MNIILSFLFFSAFAQAHYLKYTQTLDIKMKYPTAMQKYMPKKKKNMSIETTTYVHNGVMASHNKNSVTVFDPKNKVLIRANHKKRTYTKMPLTSFTDMMDSVGGQGKMKIDANYTSLHKSKKVVGEICQLYKVQVASKIKLQNNSMISKINSTECLWKNPPLAWKEYIKAFEFSKKEKVKLGKFVSGQFVAELGIALHSVSKTKTEMAGNAQVSQYMPKTVTIKNTKSISKKSFSLNKLKIPSGYKEVKHDFKKTGI